MRQIYKQTDAGNIPMEWEALQLRDCCKKITDGTHDTPSPVSAGVPYLTAIHVKDSGIAFGDCLYLSQEDHEAIYRRCNPQMGDVLMVNIGAGVATTALVDVGFEFSLKNVALLKPDFTRLSGEYLNHCLAKQKATTVQRLLSGGAQPFLSLAQIGQLYIPLPPLPEQRAISAALGDVDTLLSGLDRLIAKKRDLKQAAMQQLLTGQTRLPDFQGEWDVKRLGEVGEISGSGVDKKSRPDEMPVRLVNYMDVYRRSFIYSVDLDHAVTAQPHQARRCAVLKGDVFFTPSSETRDDIANSAVAMEDIGDAAYSYHVVRLRLTESWDLRFRTYAFKSRAFLQQAETVCDGGGTRYVISLSKFRSLIVNVPPLPEQAAIAAILSDMDDELTALDARRVKTRALKQAMMQELLTGRTRLV